MSGIKDKEVMRKKSGISGAKSCRKGGERRRERRKRYSGAVKRRRGEAMSQQM